MRFIVIKWPESQYLFDIDNWQEHCYLINDDNGLNKFGSSAYFVEEQWYNEQSNNESVIPPLPDALVDANVDERIEQQIELLAEEFGDSK